MHKVLRTTKLGLTEQDVVWDEIADIMESADRMAGSFRTQHVRTPIQQKVHDLIQNTEVPPGEVLHVLLYGSVGSGKTWTAFGELTQVLVDFPGATVLGVRRTYNEIEDALYSVACNFFDKYDIPYSTNKKLVTLYLKNGSTFRMRSAEKTATGRSDKADHLGGTEYSAAVIDEADEVPEEFAKTVAGRMRQKVGVERKVIFYICNPPSKDHWLYEWFFGEGNKLGPDDPRSRYRAVHMPVEANVEHVGQAYIDSIHQDYAENPALYKRMVRGEFGPAVRGYPIFSKYFDRDIHVAKTEIWRNWNRDLPLQRCWDFGWRRPALVVFQDDTDIGQIRVFRAILGDKILLDSFADRWVSQFHKDFPGAKWEDFCDPAGKARDDRSLQTSIDILRGKGIRPKYRRTAIEYGLNIIGEQLSMFIPYRKGPVPAMIIDPQCKVLIDAFEYGYCQEKARSDGGTFEEDAKRPIKAVKDGYYEHCMDALRYGMIFKRSPNQGKGLDNFRGGEYRFVDKIDKVRRGSFRAEEYTFRVSSSGRSNKMHGNYSFSKRRKW